MPSYLHSFTLSGIDAAPVVVEVDLLRRLPAVVIVGMPAATVRETAARVRSAIEASGFTFPRQRVVVSVTPADLRKLPASALDLPIALAILKADGQLPATFDVAAAGELSMSGELRPIRGAIAMARASVDRPILLPMDNARDAVAVLPTNGPCVYGARTLADVVVGMMVARSTVDPHDPLASYAGRALDFADVHGSGTEAVEQLVEAARTRRPALFIGPPGAGKTMLAARMPGLLPTLTDREALDIATIHDVAGLRGPGSTDLRSTLRPFRAPHHTVSAAGLIGNASGQPGEATLAHHGVLFLDEVAEFPRATLDALRGAVASHFSGGVRKLPTDFWLVAASNPCPCGLADHLPLSCRCTAEARERYSARLNHPLLRDAVRIHLDRPARGLLDAPRWPSTAELRAQVGAIP